MQQALLLVPVRVFDELRTAADIVMDLQGELRDECLGYLGVMHGDTPVLRGEGIRAARREQELDDLAGDDLQEVLHRMKAVKKADKRYDSFAGKKEDASGSVRFIIETGAVETEEGK